MNEIIDEIECRAYAQTFGLRRVATSPKYAARFVAMLVIFIGAVFAVASLLPR